MCVNDGCSSSAYARGMCRKHYNAARYQANKEEAKARQREYYQTNREAVLEQKVGYYADNKQDISTRAAAFREANRERLRAEAREYSATNREARRQRQAEYRTLNPTGWAEWAARNPGAVRAKNHGRRAALAGVQSFAVTARDVRRLFARFDGCCTYCHTRPSEPLQLDHVVPLARGGRHSIGNLTPACRSCNSSKRDRLLCEWLPSRRAALAA